MITVISYQQPDFFIIKKDKKLLLLEQLATFIRSNTACECCQQHSAHVIPTFTATLKKRQQENFIYLHFWRGGIGRKYYAFYIKRKTGEMILYDIRDGEIIQCCI